MKLFMKLASFWGGKFDVIDENGELRYKIESKSKFAGGTIFIRDYDGNEILRTEQRGSFDTHFELYAGDLRLATMRRDKRLFGKNYYIDEFGWTLIPNGWGNKFNITDGIRDVANFKAKGIFANGYEIDVTDGYDIATVLALVAAMCKVISDESAATSAVAATM